MRRVVLSAVVATACTTQLDPPKLAAPGPSPTADAIIAEMVATYANAKTYTDRGVASTVIKAGGQDHKLELAFRTAFDRPRMRFELGVDDPRTMQAIWSDGTSTRTESALLPGRVDQSDDLGRALDKSAGVSAITSILVPALLAQVPSPLHSLERAAIAGSEIVDDAWCWRIDGSVHDRPVSAFIDKRSHVLRRVVVTTHHDGAGSDAFDAVETIRYTPVLAGPVAAIASIDTSHKTVVDDRQPVWIGVRFDGTTTRVTQVLASGPAERAGVVPNDEIIAVDGNQVSHSTDVIDRVRRTKPGGRITLRIHRNTATIDVPVAAEVMPDVDKLTHDALIDRPAPDFSLPVINAIGSATLADLARDIVVVDFWATWCRPCEIARPHLNALQAKHAGKVHVVAISNEDLKDITEHLASHDIKFTVARDGDGKVWSSYIVGGLPTTVVIAKGQIRYVGVGVDDAGLDDAIAKALAAP